MLFELGYHFVLGYLDVVVSFRHREKHRHSQQLPQFNTFGRR